MKDIAIIGSGNIGGNLGRLFAAKHNVTLGSRDPEHTRTKFPDLKVADYAQAVASADIVFLAVPFSEVAAIAAKVGGLAGKTLVDVTNPLTADFMALTIGHTTSAGEAVQKAFPQARVVKAFNTVLAQVLAKAVAGAKSLPSVLIAGNHAEANAEVAQLAKDAGFGAFDTGPLTNARYLEPLAELGIQLAYGKGHGGEVGFTFAPVN
ncbi:MAG: NAD(P)-binding domain-containing protein [Opitutaceae bacterium]|nr:NAD(P)-binding domain-containing protein [Opitutaceae bacterium]